jgi:hypothetical protein
MSLERQWGVLRQLGMEDAYMTIALDQDTYEFQKERIVRIVQELAPGQKVEFDEANTWIRFRVVDETLRISLTEVSGEWEPSELADKSDDALKAFIKQLSNGKI